MNAQDNYGTTPLHAALFSENEELFEKLASLGARTDIPDEDGKTVRELCKLKAYSKMNEFLDDSVDDTDPNSEEIKVDV